jgi:hypothetical protein
MAASMKVTVFWVVAPCSLVEVLRRFRGAYRLHRQGDRPDDGAFLQAYSILTNFPCKHYEEKQITYFNRMHGGLKY